MNKAILIGTMLVIAGIGFLAAEPASAQSDHCESSAKITEGTWTIGCRVGGVVVCSKYENFQDQGCS